MKGCGVMNSQTSLVATNVRLQQWALQIRECQNRPSGMNVETWCADHGITKANYYYRMKQVRKACLKTVVQGQPEFIDLFSMVSNDTDIPVSKPAAVLRSPAGLTLEVENTASDSFIQSLVRAMIHAE